MSFQNLKKQSQSNIASLSRELEKMNKGGESFKDDRFWNIERDKSGNGFAVIRFLPACEGEEIPWARVFSHGFRGPGGDWFIENCPTTLGQKCPVCEANSVLWNSGIESDKEIARARKRKLRYISNILVVSDPAHKENEGKIFLYNYGKKIFDKITESMTPQFAGEEPINPFDFWKGRNFKLKVRTIGDFPNYDASEFASPSALFEGDDAKLEKLWKQQYKLNEFVAPAEFKSYEELQTKFSQVIAGKQKPGINDSNPASKFAAKKEAPKPADNTPPFEADIEEDDNISYFKRLASEE
jgi:hypothetical protein